MIYKNFKEYMESMHLEANPTVLDDDAPEHFDYWVSSELEWDDIESYANDFAEIKYKEGVEFGREDTIENLPELN